MSAQTDYLRAELNSAKASLNNQTLRIAANKKIEEGLKLLAARDGLEAAGVVLPAVDVAVVGAVYDPIKAAIDARNGEVVAIKDKTTLLTELAALSE